MLSFQFVPGAKEPHDFSSIHQSRVPSASTLSSLKKFLCLAIQSHIFTGKPDCVWISCPEGMEIVQRQQMQDEDDGEIFVVDSEETNAAKEQLRQRSFVTSPLILVLLIHVIVAATLRLLMRNVLTGCCMAT